MKWGNEISTKLEDFSRCHRKDLEKLLEESAKLSLYPMKGVRGKYKDNLNNILKKAIEACDSILTRTNSSVSLKEVIAKVQENLETAKKNLLGGK